MRVESLNKNNNSYNGGDMNGDGNPANDFYPLYVDENGDPQVSGGAGFAYTVPNDLYTVTNVVPDNVWNGTGYDVADTITSTIPGGGSGFEFELTAIQFLSSANIVNEDSETEEPVAGEGYVTGEQLSPGFELRSNDTLAGIGTTVTYNVQVRPKSGGGGNAFWIDLGSGYVEAPALDLNIAWVYRQNFTMGIGYRAGEAIVAQIKFKVFDALTIGYAFDFPLNKIYGNYSHEIMLGFRQCPGGGIGEGGGMKSHTCPAYAL